MTRVQAYCSDPLNATLEEFIFTGSLELSRFYVDPAKPTHAERDSLWTSVTQRIGKPGAAAPPSWYSVDGTTLAMQVQEIAEVV